MFEASLSDKLKRIFDLDKVTYASPSESQEQECIFIEIESAKNQIKDKRQVSRVLGKIRVFASSDKLPYGYFSKKIQAANTSDTRELFFYEIEENHGTFQNICERSLSFVYFYDSQYDPEQGTITSIEFD